MHELLGAARTHPPADPERPGDADVRDGVADVTAPVVVAPLDLDGLVTDAFLRHDAQHARSQQTAPGVSLTYVCQRQAALRFAGADYTDDVVDEKRAAALGTWVHAGLLPQLRRVVGGRARYEVPVEVTPWLKGHVDLWLHQDGTTLDVKTCTDSKLSKVRQEGADPKHVAAGHLYALGLRNSVKGADPQQVAVLYVGRERGDHVTVSQPYDPEVTAEALDWWETARMYGTAPSSGGPDMAPIGDRRGPGLDLVCDGCPFASRCWPGVDGARPQSRLVKDGDVMTEDALQQLADATKRKAQAEKDAEWAKALLDGTPPGQYGPWLLKRQRDTPPKPVVDLDAAKAAGLALPTKLNNGRRGGTSVAFVGGTT